MDITKELNELTKIPNAFKPMRDYADTLEATLSIKELEKLAYDLYTFEEHQIRMVAVFLFGKLSANNKDILYFMKYKVSQDCNWRVQEILAMAFDNYCKNNKYENSLSVIEDWLNFKHPNTRRAASEGLRVWTSRPYFKDNPKAAIKLLVSLKNDESEYVRKSFGNALRDISKKPPSLVINEISTWEDSDEDKQVVKLILKNKKLDPL